MRRIAIPWKGDPLAYVLAHVRAGVLRVDRDGSIWRCAIRNKAGFKPCAPRRMENVGGKGYFRISISRPGGFAIVMAHRLVYTLLVGPIPSGMQINHKDLDKKNNHPRNLETVTGSQNIRHSYASGKRPRPWSRSTEWRGRPRLTARDHQRARALRRRGSLLRKIAQKLGISITHAQRISKEPA